MAGEYRDERGTYVWRTVGGHRIKIYTGQTLSEAMKESGKFGKKKNEEKDYSKETDKEKRLKNVYMMDRVLRGMNNEEALDDGWLMAGVEDEATDHGFEAFKENSAIWDYSTNKPTGDYYYANDEDYNRLVKMYKSRVKEYAPDGVMSRDWYKAHKGNWKELAGLNDEELAFLAKDVPDFEVYNTSSGKPISYKEMMKQMKVNDDDKGFKYSFRTGKRDMFEVRYDRTGNNAEMDFATSANQFNRNRTDYTMGGQAQKDILKPNTKAMDFYNKWDKKHLQSLTGEEYDDLLKDVEGLKEQYPYIEGNRFYDEVDMDRNPDAYRQKKDLGKLSLDDRELSKLNVAGGKKYSFEEDPEFVQSVTSDLYGRPMLSVDDRDKDYAQKLYDDEIKESQRLEGILNQSHIKASQDQLKRLNEYKDVYDLYDEAMERANEMDYEYNLYKQAMTDPDSINPMTEYSTDWEALDKKYRDRYNKELAKAQKQDEILNEWGATDKARKMIAKESNKDILEKHGLNYNDSEFNKIFNKERKNEFAKYSDELLKKEHSGLIKEAKWYSGGPTPKSAEIRDGLIYEAEEELKKRGIFEEKKSYNPYDTLDDYEIYEQASKLANSTNDNQLTDEIYKRLDRIDRANNRGSGYGKKPTNELRKILKENDSAFENANIQKKYKGTIEYLQKNTDMDLEEILELLKKRGK